MALRGALRSVMRPAPVAFHRTPDQSGWGREPMAHPAWTRSLPILQRRRPRLGPGEWPKQADSTWPVRTAAPTRMQQCLGLQDSRSAAFMRIQWLRVRPPSLALRYNALGPRVSANLLQRDNPPDQREPVGAGSRDIGQLHRQRTGAHGARPSMVRSDVALWASALSAVGALRLGGNDESFESPGGKGRSRAAPRIAIGRSHNQRLARQIACAVEYRVACRAPSMLLR
jgi:hypothetical protein